MLKDDIQKFIRGEVADDSDTLAKYSKDASIFEIKPRLVVFPKDSGDIQKIVRFVNNSSERLSLTCRAAGTDMTGGAINDSIIIDTKYLNRMIELSDGYAVVQPGMMYKDFDSETLRHNLILPIYPASRDICTVGGMVAANAGGERDLAYGQLNGYVLSMKAVLADGNEYVLCPLNMDQVREKIAKNDFEGKVYKDMHELITKNAELIAEAEPKVSKNSTGYSVWDVSDGQTFDLSKLFIGSQGTLGIITEVKIKLINPKPFQALLVIRLQDVKKLAQVVEDILQYTPESFECFDKETLQLALRHSFHLAKSFKHSSRVRAYMRFLPDKIAALRGVLPALTLMANFTGESRQETFAKALSAKESLKKFRLSSAIYDTPASAEKYWIIRHKSFSLLRFSNVSGRASAFIDDIIVKPEHLSEFLPRLNELINPYKDKMVYTVAGHVGDGNFHIIPLMDLSDLKVRTIIPELMEKVFNLVFQYKGSMSAEHNDGLIRGHYLKKMYGEEMFKVFQEVKQIFDPRHIFNPHKKTDATAMYSFEHMINHA